MVKVIEVTLLAKGDWELGEELHSLDRQSPIAREASVQTSLFIVLNYKKRLEVLKAPKYMLRQPLAEKRL